MSINRAWYVYLGGASGEQNSSNYAFVNFKPVCDSINTPYVCAVYGLYDTQYGNNPAPFSTADPALSQYIIDALAADAAQPSGPFEKRFVYMQSTPYG